jgi:oligopeptidase A
MTNKTPLPTFQINFDTFESQLDTLLNENRTQLKKLLTEKTYTWDNLLAPMEEIDDALQKLWAPISHLHSVADSEKLRAVYNNCLIKLSDYQMEMMQNTALFHAIESIANSAAFENLNTAQKKIVSNALRDFKLSGVHLESKAKKRFASLNQKMAKLSTKFQEHVLDATQSWSRLVTDPAELSGLPEHALAAAKQAAENKKLSGWLFTLDMPSYLAVITYADSETLRREVYFAYTTRASDQGPHAKKWDNTLVMNQILATRSEMAALLGFKNYAEYSLATKMAKTPSEVLRFLNELSTASLQTARKELTELKQFAKEKYNKEDLQVWDLTYYSEKLSQYAYAVSKEEFRPYFPDTYVIPGLFDIIKRLYGMAFTAIENADVWHKQVRLFSIHDAQKNLRGYLYLDLYAREGKRDGAWMTDAYARRKLSNGDIQVPIGFVTCNFNAPVGDDPALLTHDDVNTLFHECGHAVQHLLTTVDYSGVAGITGIPWDAVEIASQFMENWCWEKQGIDLIAQHYQTKEPLPDDLLKKLIRAKNFQSAMQMVRQLQFSLFDFRLHLEYDPEKNNQVQTILDEVREQLLVFPTPEWNRFQHGFSHIFGGGYAAGYYSYKWAEVLACDAFSLFEERGIFDRKIGDAFLHTFLESGGSQEPMDLFIQFRGRPSKIDALLRHNGISVPEELNAAETTP